MNETKNWFFEKINKIDKPLAKLIKKTKRGPKSIKSEMRKGEVIEIQKIIRDYYKQWNEQPRRTGQIPISVQSPKNEWIRNMNR